MNKIIPFPQPRRAYDEACRWLAVLDGQASREDMDNFGRWLGANAENAQAFIRVASVWDQMDLLGELSDIFPLELYEAATRKAVTRRGFIAASACVAVASLLAVRGVLERPRNTADTFETAVGQQSTIHLSEGTEVVLNTSTSLHVAFTEYERKVHLVRGEALFTVARDASRPFRVYTGNRIVEAVGTAFTVHRNLRETVEVLVTEGRVKLLKMDEPGASPGMISVVAMEEPGEVISLEAGDYAATSSEQASEVRTRQLGVEEIESRLAWRHGMLLFQGDPLQHVLDEVSRYTLIRIEADPAIRDLIVRGYLRAGDVDGLLVMMRENFEIVAQRVDDSHIRLVAGSQSDEDQ